MLNLVLIWLNYSSPGILQLHPGAINSIPSKSHLEIGRSLFPFKQNMTVQENMMIFQLSKSWHPCYRCKRYWWEKKERCHWEDSPSCNRDIKEPWSGAFRIQDHQPRSTCSIWPISCWGNGICCKTVEPGV